MSDRTIRVFQAAFVGSWLLGWLASNGGHGTAAETRDEAPARAARTVRVAAAQPERRSLDWRIQDPAEVLDGVDRSLRELERIIGDAGAAGCEALAFPEPAVCRWKGVDHPARRGEHDESR